MHEIKSFAIVPTAKMMGAIYLIVGGVVSVFAALTALATGHPVRALLVLILFPPIYGAVSFVAFVIGAWLYNQIAERIGGIEFELVQKPSA